MPRASGVVDILVKVRETGKELIDGYRDSLTNLEAGLKKLGISGKTASKITAALGSDMAIAAGAVTGVGLAVYGMTKAAIAGYQALHNLTAAAESAAKAQRQLENAVSLSGGSLKELEKQVARLGKAYGIGTEEAVPFIAAINKLVIQAGKGSEAVGEFADGLLDLGAARDVPIGELAQAIDAAARGATRGLEQLLGVDVDKYLEDFAKAAGKTKEDLTELGRATAIYNLVTEQAAMVTGAAAKEADTAAGRYKQLTKEIGDLKEALGRFLTPLFDTLTRILLVTIDVVNWINKIVDPVKWGEMLRVLAGIDEDFSDVSSSASSAADAVKGFDDALFKVTEMKPGDAAKFFDEIVKSAAAYVDTQIKLKEAHIGTAKAQKNIADGLVVLQALYNDAMTTDEQRLVLLEKIKAAQAALAGPSAGQLAESFDNAVTAAEAYLEMQLKLRESGQQTAENTENIRRAVDSLQTLYNDARLTDEQRLEVMKRLKEAQDALAASGAAGNQTAESVAAATRAATDAVTDGTQALRAYAQVNEQTGAVIDQKFIPAIQRGQRALEGTKKTTEEATDTTKEFAQSMAEAIAGPLTEFFDVIIEGNLSLTESFKAMVRAVIKAITALIAQMLAWAAVQALFRAFGMEITTPFSPGKKAAPTGSAHGGFIRGPGSGTSDSIPARLSNGEYVMTAAAVRRLGLQNLNALNYAPRGFKDGGLVAPGAVQTGAGTLGPGTVNLGIGLQDGLVLDYLETDAGGAAIVSQIVKNKNAVRRMLGMR